MSVAFRRDCDEEHREPKFEIPIPPGPNPVTRRGLDLIELRQLELEAEIARERDEVRLAELKRDLRYWGVRHATARVAPPPPLDKVAFGSRVRFTLGDEPRTAEIVGSDEADPASGRLAFSSPLARALIGADVGDRIDFHGRKDAITIIAIGRSDT